MKTLLVSDDRHKEWKIYCSKNGIKMLDATDFALAIYIRRNAKKK